MAIGILRLEASERFVRAGGGGEEGWESEKGE